MTQFDPSIHLIPYTDSTSKLERSINQLPLFSSKCKSYLELHSDKIIPIFTLKCIEVIESELINYKQENPSVSTSPSLESALSLLPFTFDALTHPSTLSLISKYLGFSISPIMHYEFVHFSKTKNPIIIHEKSVAYPFICIIQLPKVQKHFSYIPPGHLFILKGRVIENISFKFSKSTNENNNYMVLCPFYTPDNQLNYEDKESKVNTNRYIENKSSIINDDSLHTLNHYTSWLNNYYTV
ncbi:hypothetical protein DAPK24_050150 [Pichia kluyveri]|uniref:Uncharacterized protein n=1 Tax=Pichia kluyveri TaxID=36015 RepID=A0AAV5RBF1_PICKL|nr:hypothetical protein DAPK24_050150 [Pichia kluyveri]